MRSDLQMLPFGLLDPISVFAEVFDLQPVGVPSSLVCCLVEIELGGILDSCNCLHRYSDLEYLGGEGVSDLCLRNENSGMTTLRIVRGDDILSHSFLLLTTSDCKFLHSLL